MQTTFLISLGFGLFLGIIHFFSENLRPPEGERRYRVISFAAGISIAYLFLDLLPHTYQTATYLKNFVFAFLLLGFVLFHFIEKYIYKHVKGKVLARELKEVHSANLWEQKFSSPSMYGSDFCPYSSYWAFCFSLDFI